MQNLTSHSARSAWIEMENSDYSDVDVTSHSARSAWIEIIKICEVKRNE